MADSTGMDSTASSAVRQVPEDLSEDIVHRLLSRPFSTLSVGEKKAVVNLRPVPDLTRALKSKDRSFQLSWYKRKDWLCGSSILKRLFCWPCLLFRRTSSKTWATTGYINVHSFLCDCVKHEKSKAHLEAYKQWKTFDSVDRVDVLFSRARRQEIERHNEMVRQNREILKTITLAVLYLGKQELPFRGGDESEASINKGNYRELLECFAKLDSVFERRLHGQLVEQERSSSGGSFRGVSPTIQNDLIHALDDIIQDKIDKDIANSSFVSIQLDEATDVSTKEQLSIILRLDSEGKIEERFLGFIDVSADRGAAAITSNVIDVLKKYGEPLKRKLIMQTYDGAAVMSG